MIIYHYIMLNYYKIPLSLYIYIYICSPALPRPYFSHFLCLLCVSGLLIQLMHGPHRVKKRSSISEHLLYWLSGVCGDGPNNSGGVIGTLMPMCGAIPMGGVGGGGPGRSARGGPSWASRSSSLRLHPVLWFCWGRPPQRPVW